MAVAKQKVISIRRDYNRWVANETMEDYALRFAPTSFRKWSEFRVANTALGGISFLALEAIGGAITINYGFTNAFWAIIVVGLIIFVIGTPICYYAAKHGIDIDLLTRGAGFGYIGSTVTSLIYAFFTFIFFAIEAAIMALALELYFGIPLSIGYVISSLVIIPMVMHGVTFISKLQSWTQPLWLLLLVLPYLFIFIKGPDALRTWTTFAGKLSNENAFDWALFGAACTVIFSLVAQIGEQVDFLRFLPPKRRDNRIRWWCAMLSAGPGWIVLGVLKMLGGGLLAFLVLQSQIETAKASQPTQMYLVGFGYVFSDPRVVLAVTVLFVLLSQIKINVTNAYAGSLAWSNFFARVTHSHPGRVVWVVFNVLIALVLMELGVFEALEHVLGLYSILAMAWIGTLAADLCINKPLKLSPPCVDFRRAYLFDVNPVGIGSMLLSSAAAVAAFVGMFGSKAQAFSPFLAFAGTVLLTPTFAYLTGGRYYLARQPIPVKSSTCTICGNVFEKQDLAGCPAYGGTICSLCCSLEVRCNDGCRSHARASELCRAWINKLLPQRWAVIMESRLGHFLGVFLFSASILAAALGFLFYFEVAGSSPGAAVAVAKEIYLKVFLSLLLLAGIGAWWFVLAQESRHVAEEESRRQTDLLFKEIEAHRQTDAQLQHAKEAAEAANSAKSRYVTGISHELRTPLNSILGFAHILSRDQAVPPHRRDAIDVIRRSSEHLASLIDGLLDIAKIEAGKIRLSRAEFDLFGLLAQLTRMFRVQAESKGLDFRVEVDERLPRVVFGDEKRLNQVLINLLGNALKFTNQGSVTLRAQYQRQMAQFEVEDTGIGISPRHVVRLFEPFERGASDQPLGPRGTGLGLAICRMLVNLMGGELSVESTLGTGSIFRARLLLSEVRVPSLASSIKAPVIGYFGPVRRVLVVDDEPAHRQILAENLEALGFSVKSCEDGPSCLDQVADVCPDLILLDVAMPGMDGWETARRLRAERGVNVPIVAVSANPFDTEGRQETAGVFDDAISKPLDLTILLDKVALHLNLEWEAQRPPTVRGAPSTTEDPVPPPLQELQVLLAFLEIGHIKAFDARLCELESRTPNSAFCKSARALLQRFRLVDLRTLIDDARAYCL
jgi:signal transduction histidine kinase/CheY-like chemotaxis protein/purine-cytosine permease-like protein